MIQTQQQNVPALRFPEFNGEWATKTLDELCSIQAGNFVKTSEISPEKTEGFFRCYGGNGLRGYVSDYNREGRFALIGRQGALCGNVHFVEGKFHATEHALVADAREGEMADWLFHLLGRMNLNQYSTGLAQPGISAEVIKKIRAKAPTLPEQQKIAAFLSSVDIRIAQLGQKKALLQRYKKGMMQKLFSQELRFKDAQGHDFLDWEEKRLGEVVQKVSESFNPATSSENWQSVELESLGQGNGKILKTFPVQNLQSIKTKFQKGDVLFGKLRPYLRKFARPDFDGVCTSEIWVLRAKIILGDFLFFLIQSERFNQFANIQSGSKMPRSDWKIVSGARYSIPSLPEQQKIADFLSSIDRKIGLVSTELDHAKVFKKGLLQQMFI